MTNIMIHGTCDIWATALYLAKGFFSLKKHDSSNFKKVIVKCWKVNAGMKAEKTDKKTRTKIYKGSGDPYVLKLKFQL